MADITGATSAASQVINTVSNSGPVSAIGGALGNVSSLFSGIPKKVFPLPNVLASYASYEYVISLSCLTKKQLEQPDLTYIAGAQLPLLAKTANMDPNNRITTAYGKFDFFIENLVMNNAIAQKSGKAMFTGNITFDIIEPYSMGLFLQCVQEAAYKNGMKSYTEAPFLFKIEFRGAKENGVMSTVPDSTRYFVLRFTEIDFKVTSGGTVYHCKAFDWSHGAKTQEFNKLRSDHAVQGKTIREVLQSGPNSLQSVVNAKFKDLVKQGVLKDADEIAIIFPTADKIPSSGAIVTSSPNVTATQSTNQQATSSIYSTLGLTRDNQQNLIQQDTAVNEIGSCAMDFSFDRKPNAVPTPEDSIWDPNKQTWVRSNIKVDPTTGVLTFPQDSTVTNAIVQTILSSGYTKKAFGENGLDDKGQRNWFNIDTQVYIISDANLKVTGKFTKLLVYRIVPYKVHASTFPMAPGVKPPYKPLVKEAVKWYNYIYTGKNTEVIDFNIQFSTAFANLMAADSFRKNPKVIAGASEGSGVNKADTNSSPNPIGEGNDVQRGNAVSKIDHTITNSWFDRQGGPGIEDDATRAARVFHQAATKGNEMMSLDLKIVGDPYFLPDSGSGNYTAKPTSQQNLNANGSVNYQNGQVDIIVNFRTPIDINQATGLYNFGAGTKTVPVTTWSGLYYVTSVRNEFRGGKFTQTLTGNRRPNQELDDTAVATGAQLGNVTEVVKKISDYATGVIGGLFGKSN
jgi:hypothetical protein